MYAFTPQRQTDSFYGLLGLLHFRLRRPLWGRPNYLKRLSWSFWLLLFLSSWLKIRQWQLIWLRVIFAVVFLQPCPTSKSTSPELTCWIYAAKRFCVHLLMLITFCRSPEPVGMPIAFSIATNECGISVNLLKLLQFVKLYAFGQGICCAINQRTNSSLICLTDLTESSWIMFQLVGFQT